MSVQCDDAPVTDLSASEFTLTENGSPVSGAEGQFLLQRSDAALQASTLLLLDVSASVVAQGTLDITRAVATEFADAVLAANQGLAIALFDGAAEIRSLVDWTADATRVHTALEGLGPDDQVDPSTNLNGAVIQGLTMLDERLAPEVEGALLSVGNLVIFTDGVDRAARESSSAARDAVAAADHSVFLVALTGDDTTAEDLSPLARDGFFRADEPAELSAAFGDLAESLVAETQKFYRISYCSPLRRPRATLRVDVTREEETDSLTFAYPTGDFGAGCALPAE